MQIENTNQLHHEHALHVLVTDTKPAMLHIGKAPYFVELNAYLLATSSLL